MDDSVEFIDACGRRHKNPFGSFGREKKGTIFFYDVRAYCHSVGHDASRRGKNVLDGPFLR